MNKPKPTNQSRKLRNRRRINIIVIALVSMFMVGLIVYFGYEHGRNQGYWDTTDSTRHLLKQPTVDTDGLGLELTLESLPGPASFPIGKTPPPAVSRCYIFKDQDKAAIIQAVTADARKNGWLNAVQSDEPATRWRGTKMTVEEPSGNDYEMALSITTDNQWPCAPGQLNIHISYN